MTIKVIGYGDNVVDRYVNKRIMFPGGNALNFAVNAQKNGVEAAYLGEFGNDPEGIFIHSVLSKMGLDIRNCKISEEAVTEKANVELIDGDRKFVGTERGTRRAIELTSTILDYISSFKLLHSGCHAATEKQLSRLEKLSIMRSFDFSDPPKYRTKNYLDLVCPYIDFALFSCSENSEAEINRLLHICASWNVRFVLMTRGAKPPLFYADEKKYEGTVKPLENVVDTMGAGDAYFTAFISSLLKDGWSLTRPLQYQQIEKAFQSAATYSAETCQVDGSFGCGIAY